MPLLPKCRCKLANGCHESYDSRLHFVCVRCVALHLRDYQLRIKFRKNGQRGQSPCGRAAGTVPEWAISTPGGGDSPRVVISPLCLALFDCKPLIILLLLLFPLDSLNPFPCNRRRYLLLRLHHPPCLENQSDRVLASFPDRTGAKCLKFSIFRNPYTS